MKKILVIFLILVVIILAGCNGEKPEEILEEEPMGDEYWTLGFSIVPDTDELINATVRLGEELYVELPLVITKEGEVSGSLEDRGFGNGIIGSVKGQGTYNNQKLVFTGNWEVETHTQLSHTSSVQGGMFKVEGEYIDNMTFDLNKENSTATITSKWELERSTGVETGEDIYEKAPEIKVLIFRPKPESWSPDQ